MNLWYDNVGSTELQSLGNYTNVKITNTHKVF